MSERELMTQIGRNLKSILEDYRMSQQELAEETEISRSTISRYINGEQMMSLKNLINIVYALDCDIEDLIDASELIE